MSQLKKALVLDAKHEKAYGEYLKLSLLNVNSSRKIFPVENFDIYHTNQNISIKTKNLKIINLSNFAAYLKSAIRKVCLILSLSFKKIQVLPKVFLNFETTVRP